MTLVLLAPAGAASAQAAYPGNRPAGEVLGTGDQRGDTEVLGVVTTRAADPAPTVAGRGLAVTGADVAQLSALGLALVAGGAVVLRRSRRLPVPA